MITRPTILVVDDDPALARALRRRLTSAGYEIRLADDGLHAVQVALSERPDLILLDLVFPGTDGLEVLQHLRTHPQLVDIPVLIVSGRSARTYAAAALQQGACAYIEKPFEDAALMGEIAKWLAQRSPSSGPTSPVVSGAHLLLVDDDPDFLKALGLRLRSLGFTVTTTTDGYSAMAHMRDDHPDLVLMDFHLPGPDGMSVLRRMAALQDIAGIPVIVLSGMDSATHAPLALAAGAVGWIEKPVDVEELLVTVNRELHGRPFVLA